MEPGDSHADADRAGGADRREHASSGRFEADFVGRDEAPIAREHRHAAHPVAALLRPGAVGVEDHHAEVVAGIGGRHRHQDLIAPDSLAAVGEAADLPGIRQGRPHRVRHDEVIADAVHLGKAQAHVREGTNAKRGKNVLVAVSPAPAMTSFADGEPHALEHPSHCSRSAIQNLMSDCLVMPRRLACTSSPSTIHTGKSTLTRFIRVFGRLALDQSI